MKEQGQRVKRFIMCLVKRKDSKTKSNGSIRSNGSPNQHEVIAWASRTSSRVNQVDDSSSSLELTSPSGFTPNHSKESQVSSSSTGSKGSLTSAREVVGGGAIVFQYKELSRATDSFSLKKKIGNSVYRGTVRGGIDVAISVLKKGDMYSDLVPKLKSLCSVHHVNVISMIGACSTESGDYVYGVYEFMQGSKLRECLRSVHSPGYSVLNSWTRRLQVALDVAKGLEYMHESTHPPLVHKYVKSNNILVDNDTLRARIAQFGNAQLAGEIAAQELLDQSGSSFASTCDRVSEIEEAPAASPSVTRRLGRSRSKKLTGTRGYMAPEYMKTGAVTDKLDVFAFGIILLELLSGQEAIIYYPDPGSNVVKRSTLAEAIKSIFDDPQPRAKLRQWMDPHFKDSYPLPLALKAAQLAKACVDANPVLRPEMRSVALTLTRIMMESVKWEANMIESKNQMSRTMEAR